MYVLHVLHELHSHYALITSVSCIILRKIHAGELIYIEMRPWLVTHFRDRHCESICNLWITTVTYVLSPCI